jgi:hypothetical protein
MNKKLQTTMLWILAVVITIIFVIWQRTTGPTYPISDEVTINGIEIDYKLLRTWEGSTDQQIPIFAPDGITGKITYKRFPSHDEWTTAEMTRRADSLVAFLPNQPAAGKIEYLISLFDQNGTEYKLNEEPAVTRYKGVVPLGWLLVHIFFIFSAFLFSMRTGLEALFKRDNVINLSIITVIMLTIGGMVMGPIIQKYAFDAYWTGWPFGHDLTDNKTLAGLIMWIIAIWQMRKNPDKKWWALVAAATVIVVFLIPHSVMGSEIDFTKDMPKN